MVTGEMGEAELRRDVATMPVPTFAGTAYTKAPPLREATVAIVTSAGLHRADHPGWQRGDESFNIILREERELQLGHVSPNFDRAGLALDINLVFPLDRLEELAAEDEIRGVASRHLAFMGAQHGTLSTIRMDIGPAAGRVLRGAHVDVVLLTPVCPLCTRTLSTLAHPLEAAGLATVVIALVREHAERICPPRALYCDFPFGRPLGHPLDPPFQRRVLMAALDLLGRPAGPVLEDFPEAIGGDGGAPLSCALPPAQDPSLRLAVNEAIGLRPAYDRHVRKVGRTLVGRVTGPDGVPPAVDVFARIADGEPWRELDPAGDLALSALDVRSFYEEAAIELSGHVPAAHAAESWFFQRTETGRVLLTAQAVLRASGAPRSVWYYLVPRTQAGHRLGRGSRHGR